MNQCIRFEKVTKYYGEKKIVDDVSLSIDKGELVTVLGPSGSGKTTMLKMINGIVQPDNGSIYVYDQDVSKCDIVNLRRRIGYVVQETVLFPHLDIYHNISYVPSLIGISKSKTKRRVRDLVDMLQLDKSMLKRYCDELSGGEKQRIGIARALAASPEIMLMDEPFGALDPETREILQDELLRIWKELNMTIFFITHDVSEAEKLGSRILVMNDGVLEDKVPAVCVD